MTRMRCASRDANGKHCLLHRGHATRCQWTNATGVRLYEAATLAESTPIEARALLLDVLPELADIIGDDNLDNGGFGKRAPKGRTPAEVRRDAGICEAMLGWLKAHRDASRTNADGHYRLGHRELGCKCEGEALACQRMAIELRHLMEASPTPPGKASLLRTALHHHHTPKAPIEEIEAALARVT